LQSSKMRKFNFRNTKSRIRVPRLSLPDLHGPRSRLLLIIAGVVGFAIIAAAGYGFWYTSQPEYCKSCHELSPAIQSWQKQSLHAEVDCGVCHYTGPLGFLKQKTDLAVEIYRHYTNSYQQPINVDSALSKKIDNDGCLQCHTPKRIVTPTKGLKMNHNIHLKKGINCTTCHNRAGHPGLPEYRTFLTMDGCFRCHGLSKSALAPGSCFTCHPQKGFDLVPSDGYLNHKTGTWRIPDHGKTALKNIEPCLMCHQKTFCRGCHGVEVPHTDKFIKQDHGGIGSQNPQICKKCHRQQDFCNSCHHKGFIGPPGSWIPMHRYVVAKQGPAYCFNCHGPTFCAWCHVRGQKQPNSERLKPDPAFQTSQQ
ncbi:MAG: hypothetical protein COW32_01200, partial [Candidatus Aquicultor secundus]